MPSRNEQAFTFVFLHVWLSDLTLKTNCTNSKRCLFLLLLREGPELHLDDPEVPSLARQRLVVEGGAAVGPAGVLGKRKIVIYIPK